MARKPARGGKPQPPKGRGGRRPGAGRPPAPPPGAPVELPWREVERFASTGAPEAEIVTALGITELQLADRSIADRFRGIIARAHAQYRLNLREVIKLRGNRSSKTAGSVNALALQARNHLDWDRQIPDQQLQPDLVGARERLRDTFMRLAAARGEIEGRILSPLELAYIEAFAGGVPKPPAGGAGE